MIQALAGILAGTGAYFIAADLLRIPFLRTSKAASNLSKRQKKKTSSLELWLQSLSQWIAGKLRLNEYKKLQLQSDLQTAGVNIPPEQHVANALVKGAVCGVFAIPAFIIFPLLSPVFLLLGIAIFLRNTTASRNVSRKSARLSNSSCRGWCFSSKRPSPITGTS